MCLSLSLSLSLSVSYISVSVPPRSTRKILCVLCVRGQDAAKHAKHPSCGAWLYGVHRTCANTAAVPRGTSHVTTKQRCKCITSVEIPKRAMKGYSHSFRIACNKSSLSEAPRELRTALCKSDQRQHERQDEGVVCMAMSLVPNSYCLPAPGMRPAQATAEKHSFSSLCI